MFCAIYVFMSSRQYVRIATVDLSGSARTRNSECVISDRHWDTGTVTWSGGPNFTSYVSPVELKLGPLLHARPKFHHT